MKTKILLAAALMGVASLSAQAGVRIGFGFGLPLPVPTVAVAAPAPVVVPAPIVAAPVVPAPAVVATVGTCPGPDYYWAPGYWYGRAWVPGCWRLGGILFPWRLLPRARMAPVSSVAASWASFA